MSERLRVGFVGAGWMGSTQLRRLSERSDVEVVALCEPNLSRGRTLLDDLELHDTDLVDDYSKIVNNPVIDAVWLVSPNSHHGAQSIAALESGKHVFCEKPVATTFGEYTRQLELSRSNPHLKTFVDYIIYFDQFEQHLRQLMAQGAFGKITQVQVNYRHPVNITGDKSWKLKRSVMGDAIGMGIVHAIAAMLYLMESQTRVASVYATSMPAQDRNFEADPIWNIQLLFQDGACGYIAGNIDSSNGYDMYHNINGTHGALVYDSLADKPQKVRMWQSGIADNHWMYPLDYDRCKSEGVDPWPKTITTPDSGDVVKHQTTASVEHFIECIREDRESPLSFLNSVNVAEIGWAAQISARINKPVSLPLDNDWAADQLQKL